MTDRMYLVPAGLAAVCLLMGGTFALLGRRAVDTAAAARAWPSTEGVVVTSARTMTQYRDPKTGYMQDQQRISFDYTYVVDGRAYTGHKLTPGLSAADFGDIESRYPVGTEVSVFYDPAAPAESALSVDVADDGSTMFYTIGFGVMMIAVPFGYLSFRVARARPSH